MKALLATLFLVSSVSFAQQPALPLIHCDVNGQSLELQVTSTVHLEMGIRKHLEIGDDLFVMDTNNGLLSLVLVNKQNQKYGPDYFSATYSHFEGAKNLGGFTGRVIVHTHGPAAPYVAFLCYEKVY